MLVFLLLTGLSSVAGVALLVAMYVRDDSLLGVLALILLCLAGATAATHGILSSAT
jgi:hypothetical protein